jgi:16S rRNA (cytosine1402-N4)-methyltransferase
MLNKELQHKPVMCEEVLSILNPSDGCVYLDGTLGAGGHSRKILESADCSVVGIDKDPTAIELCRDLEKQYGNKFLSINGSFGNLSQHLNSIGINKIDGILLDLGTSSMQLGTPERGFSFQFDAPLDMRMTQTGERAYDIINSLSEDSLADIIFYFGEERRSRKIAKAIVNKRKIKKIKTTFDLNEIILSVKKANNKKIHPATKTFQALRIYINNELKDLYEALISIEKVLSEKGRLVVISFHSLEDRIVKNFIKENSIPLRKYDPKNPDKIFVYENRKVIKPSEYEVKKNRRSRSAKLRWVFRSSLKLSQLNSSHNFINYGGIEC